MDAPLFTGIPGDRRGHGGSVRELQRKQKDRGGAGQYVTI